ncbi:MAG: SMP-30/gluconolactonase/LRE family protein [Nitrospirales bacterium]|nr:SMP-30/gluconolactonase/LRE family protein [Nitrospirales bacterium]
MAALAPGAITTVAGTGEPGCSGDGGPATGAMLNEPKSVTLAGHCLYIADAENHRIRKVDLATGVITTVAGQGTGDAGAAPPPADTRVPITEPSPELDPLADPVQSKDDKVVQLADQSGTVRYLVGAAEKGRFKGDGGPATAATLNFPSAVAVDSRGTLYIADTFNHRLRIVDAATGLIRTLAGTGAARFSGDGWPADTMALNEPVALVLDEQRGRLYIADLGNYRVRMMELKTGVISTYAGSGVQDYDGDGQPARQAGLTGPSGLALDAAGNLYIADTFCGRVRRVDAATGLISTLAGDGTEYRYQGVPNEFSTGLARPSAIALATDGTLYITDSDNHLIRKWNPRSKIITAIAGNGQAQFTGDGGPAAAASLNYPFGVALDASGNIYIADTFNHRIRMVSVA